MHVLVTGGAGFLGREFVKHHVAQGDDVLAVDDMSNPLSYFVPRTQKYVADIRHMPAWILRAEWDRVYHFAAQVGGRERIEKDPMYNADSLELDAFMFRWLTRVDKKPLLVYPSSSAVYGIIVQNRAGATKLSEDMFDPADVYWDAPDEMYGFTKMAGEILAYKAAQYGVTTVALRPFSGYGEEQSLDYPFPSLMQRFKRREDVIEVWGDGTQVRDFIHVDDIVRATQEFAHNAQEGTYEAFNVGTGVPVSFNTLIGLTGKVVGYDGYGVRHLLDKPVGVEYRVADTEKMYRYYLPKVALREGIERWHEFHDK